MPDIEPQTESQPVSQMQQRLTLLSAPQHLPLLCDITHGIEKESLRVTTDGGLALTPHQAALGSALTHPEITTDYSEALLEFITPPSTSIEHTLKTLEALHRYTYAHIGEELLWVNSMPCVLGQDSDIPEAQYGHSNIGKMKRIYRIGLGHRYGRLMQTIAGIHYNFSLPDSIWEILKQSECNNCLLRDYKTSGYFALIRNFRRYFWLLLYLFGASPAVCRSFVRGRQHNLQPFDGDQRSLFAPNATSLRMGDLGYQSRAQDSLVVCYNGLESYIHTLRKALTTPYAAYEEVGLKGPDGEYRQLNTHLLQIENEFYSPIRPKRTTHSGEAPVRALWDRGVEYIEVRCLDLNPYLPVGIDAQQMRFMTIFLLYCLLQDSPKSDSTEYGHIAENQRRLVYFGRDHQLQLHNNSGKTPLRDWAAQLLDNMVPIAKLLDGAHGVTDYSAALKVMILRAEQPQLGPAAQLLAEMRDNNATYFHTALKHAYQHREYFLDRPLDAALEEQFQAQAAKSLEKQQAIEATDTLSFDDYLAQFYRGYNFELGS